MKYLKYLKNFLLPFSLISSLMAAEVPSMVESWTKKLEGRKIKTYFDDESIVVRPNDYFYLCPHGKFINIVGRPAREVLRIVGADTYTGTWEVKHLLRNGWNFYSLEINYKLQKSQIFSDVPNVHASAPLNSPQGGLSFKLTQDQDAARDRIYLGPHSVQLEKIEPFENLCHRD